jgi:glycosyltransferase involved in cell wall biosynthesis
LRTLIVFHVAEMSGPAKTMLPRLRRLAELGHVDVLVPGSGPTAEACEDFANVETAPYGAVIYPGGPLDLARAAGDFGLATRRFARHFRGRRPDLVVAVTTMIPAALAAARAARTPCVAYAAEIVRTDGRGAGRAFAARSLLRYTARAADGIVCCSDEVAAQFDRLRAPAIRTIPPGIAIEPPSGDRPTLRKRFGVPLEARCLAVVGNITHARGQDVLVRAVERLSRSGDAYCLIAGPVLDRRADRAYQASLVELARRLRVDHLLRFLGYVDPVSDVYEAADMVVNPARFPEPFGRAPLEALLAGRPVVATRVGAVPSVLRHDVDALLVDAEDEAALAAAVQRLWREPRLTDRLVETGRTSVLERFDPVGSTAEFCNFALAVADRGLRAA